MKYWLLSLLLLNIGCATLPKPYVKHTLIDQILRPRPGYTGLTNSHCALWENDECKKVEIEERQLTPEFRIMANDFKFICNIGGRRFKICLDKEGFCRLEEVPSCLLCKTKTKEIFIPITDYQYLLDANTKCFNKEKYSFWD